MTEPRAAPISGQYQKDIPNKIVEAYREIIISWVPKTPSLTFGSPPTNIQRVKPHNFKVFIKKGWTKIWP